jgi:hypothetical protein
MTVIGLVVLFTGRGFSHLPMIVVGGVLIVLSLVVDAVGVFVDEV